MRKLKNISLLLFIFGLFIIQYYLFIPITKKLLNSSPSVIGVAEFIIFLVHSFVGIFIFFIYFLLEKALKLNTILSITIIFTFLFDYVIYSYGQVWMIIGLFTIKFILLFYTYKYYKNGDSNKKLNLIISLIAIFIIILIYEAYNKF
jgi:hypothetical protein